MQLSLDTVLEASTSWQSTPCTSNVYWGSGTVAFVQCILTVFGQQWWIKPGDGHYRSEVLGCENLLELLLLLFKKKLLLLLRQERRSETQTTTRRRVIYQPFKWWHLVLATSHLSTYGLTLLGNGNPWARACGLRGGGCGRKVGNVAWEALPKGEWITPFRLLSTPFIFNWGIPAAGAMSPLTVCREELLDWLTATTPSLKLRLRPFRRDWPKEAGLCCGGGVLWKEREELLRDGLPERSSWRKIKINEKCFMQTIQILRKKVLLWMRIYKKTVKAAPELWKSEIGYYQL